ncbi:MAG: di-trans,poly-cis-decaprenylcistransferase [Anaerolineales bacterium]|nr:di-trans,poly-cis-decaprenylcistransferase [Anaerolineales bacterium]MCW5854460.1 di-trans,poly-cis-decaprenylcistransferase [Anaerolineales bacterium]
MAKTDPPADHSIPQHIAIIMDGNGRWARARGLPRLAGHRAGTENLRRIIEACVEVGVKYLTIYAFSTENWGRPQDEVQGLMGIFDEVFERELAELHRQGARLNHIGRLEGMRPSLREKVLKGMQITKDNDRLVLNVAFNYGGRDEIVDAIKAIIAAGTPAEQVNAELVSQHLYTAGIPDPDLIIRTSGEQRISNFLLWQAAYAEWIFPETFWPDFGREQLLAAIEQYGQRERRYGKVLES